MGIKQEKGVQKPVELEDPFRRYQKSVEEEGTDILLEKFPKYANKASSVFKRLGLEAEAFRSAAKFLVAGNGSINPYEAAYLSYIIHKEDSNLSRVLESAFENFIRSEGKKALVFSSNIIKKYAEIDGMWKSSNNRQSPFILANKAMLLGEGRALQVLSLEAKSYEELLKSLFLIAETTSPLRATVPLNSFSYELDILLWRIGRQLLGRELNDGEKNVVISFLAKENPITHIKALARVFKEIERIGYEDTIPPYKNLERVIELRKLEILNDIALDISKLNNGVEMYTRIEYWRRVAEMELSASRRR